MIILSDCLKNCECSEEFKNKFNSSESQHYNRTDFLNNVELQILVGYIVRHSCLSVVKLEKIKEVSFITVKDYGFIICNIELKDELETELKFKVLCG